MGDLLIILKENMPEEKITDEDISDNLNRFFASAKTDWETNIETSTGRTMIVFTSIENDAMFAVERKNKSYCSCSGVHIKSNQGMETHLHENAEKIMIKLVEIMRTFDYFAEVFIDYSKDA